MDSPKPVIAAINGAAFAGGLGLVGASDIVISRKNVQFSFSEVRIGVIPAIISVVCLPKLGTHHGMKVFLTGERFDGDQAVAMGLAHRAVEDDELHSAVQEEIDMINLGGPIAGSKSVKNWCGVYPSYLWLTDSKKPQNGARACSARTRVPRAWRRSARNVSHLGFRSSASPTLKGREP